MTNDSWHIEYYSFSESGKRVNNEDTYYIEFSESKRTGLFIVCDGVGGQNKGEVASSLVCSSIKDFLVANPITDDIKWVQDAIKFTEQNFDLVTEKDYNAKGMASTLALVVFTERDLIVAHCGDSRVYHFRNKEILFQTRDHSYTNLLILRGEISQEEAIVHPKKNVITRCIEGVNNPTKADVSILDNLMSGDFILICTDGVMEAWSDVELANLMLPDLEIQLITKSLILKCDSLSNDNYTAILIKILNNVYNQ